MRRLFPLLVLWTAIAFPASAQTTWNELTRATLELRDEASNDAATFELEFDDAKRDLRMRMDGTDGSGKKMRASALVLSGSLLLTQGVPVTGANLIDFVDAPVLEWKILMAVLAKAYPRGPAAVPREGRIAIDERKTGIRATTAGSEAYVAPPWTATGVVRRTGDKEYAFELEIRSAAREPGASAGPTRMSGRLAMARLPIVEDNLPFAGWELPAGTSVGNAKTFADLRKIVERK